MFINYEIITMKILIVGDFVHEMYQKAFYDAFKDLGCEVETYVTKNDLSTNIVINFLYYVQNRVLFGPTILKLNKGLIKQVQNQKPNLVFLYRTPEIHKKTIVKIREFGSKVFSYNNDDPFSGIPSLKYWRHYLKASKVCDYNFVYRDKNLNDFYKIGVDKVRVLRSYYIKENNFFIESEKIFDVVFIGHFENDGRDKYIKALLDSGIKITVFGDEHWKKAPLYDEIKSIVHNAKRGVEYNQTLNKSKIAIVFLSKINNDTYTRRCFEIPATKTLMLAEYTDDLNSLFKADEEAVYFNNEVELVMKCKSLLEDESLLKAISLNGFDKLSKTGHEVKDRANEIIKTYEYLNKLP